MTLAERQARYRAAHAADTAGTVKVRYRRPADPPTGAAAPSGGVTRRQS